MSAPLRHPARVVNLVYTPANRAARKPQLTQLEEIELVSWYKARCALGTWKTKAVELGTTEATLHGVVERRLGLR